jgi:hypothetical protein
LRSHKGCIEEKDAAEIILMVPERIRKMHEYTQLQMKTAVEEAIQKYGSKLNIIGYDIDGRTLSVDIQTEPERRKTVTIVEPAQIQKVRFTIEDGGQLLCGTESKVPARSAYEETKQAMTCRYFVSYIAKRLYGFIHEED